MWFPDGGEKKSWGSDRPTYAERGETRGGELVNVYPHVNLIYGGKSSWMGRGGAGENKQGGISHGPPERD